MSKFTDRLWRDIVREHGAELRQMEPHEQPRQRWGVPRLLAGTGLVGIAGAGAALAVVLSAGSAAPAFAVTHNSDGSYSVNITRLQAIPAVNARMRALGLHADFVAASAGCAAPVEALRAAKLAAVQGRVETMSFTRISPDQVPNGKTLVVPAVKQGGVVRMIAPKVISAEAVPSCVPVAVHPCFTTVTRMLPGGGDTPTNPGETDPTGTATAAIATATSSTETSPIATATSSTESSPTGTATSSTEASPTGTATTPVTETSTSATTAAASTATLSPATAVYICSPPPPITVCHIRGSAPRVALTPALAASTSTATTTTPTATATTPTPTPTPTATATTTGTGTSTTGTTSVAAPTSAGIVAPSPAIAARIKAMGIACAGATGATGPVQLPAPPYQVKPNVRLAAVAAAKDAARQAAGHIQRQDAARSGK